MKKHLAMSLFMSLSAGCAGQRVDLGDQESSSAVGTSIAATTSRAAPGATCPPGKLYGAGVPDTGYVGGPPEYCDGAPGAPLTSIDAISQAIVGVWASCERDGIEFTSDGHFYGRVSKLDGSYNMQLVRASGAGPSAVGTYTLVDASSTLGPGTFQLRVTGNDGTSQIQQIQVFQSPTRIRLSNSASGAAVDYMKAMTFDYQANLCGVTPAGACYAFTSAQDVLNHLVGRWALCGGAPAFPGGLGMEIRSDGSWTTLTQDLDGNLVPTQRPREMGTVTISPSLTAPAGLMGPASLPYYVSVASILPPDAGATNYGVGEPAFTLSPTTLMFPFENANDVWQFSFYVPLP